MLQFGIIGAGRLGTTHADSLSKMEGVKLAAVYDINPEKAKTMHEKYGPAVCNSA